MVGSACIPVAAYSPVTIDWREGTDFTNSFEKNSDWLYFTETEEAIDLPEDEINFKYSDTYVILDTGEIVLVDEHDAALGAARTSCSHNYVSGIAKTSCSFCRWWMYCIFPPGSLLYHLPKNSIFYSFKLQLL